MVVSMTKASEEATSRDPETSYQPDHAVKSKNPSLTITKNRLWSLNEVLFYTQWANLFASLRRWKRVKGQNFCKGWTFPNGILLPQKFFPALSKNFGNTYYIWANGFRILVETVVMTIDDFQLCKVHWFIWNTRPGFLYIVTSSS